MTLLDRVQRLSRLKQRRAEQQRRLAGVERARARALSGQAKQALQMAAHQLQLATLEGQAGLTRQSFYARLRQAAVARAQSAEQSRLAQVHLEQAQQAHQRAERAMYHANVHERAQRKVDHWGRQQQRLLQRRAQLREQDQIQEDFVCQPRFS